MDEIDETQLRQICNFRWSGDVDGQAVSLMCRLLADHEGDHAMYPVPDHCLLGITFHSDKDNPVGVDCILPFDHDGPCHASVIDDDGYAYRMAFEFLGIRAPERTTTGGLVIPEPERPTVDPSWDDELDKVVVPTPKFWAVG